MIRGIILSHTPIGASGFCTNVVLRDPVTRRLRQVRPRLSPNDPLDLSSFGYSVNDMRENWWPGHYVDIEKFREVHPDYRRSTHPEDVNFEGQVKLYTNGASAADWEKVTQAFTFPTLRDLLPPLEITGNQKGTIQQDEVLAQSVGYVRVPKAAIEDGFKQGTYEVRCTDASGVTVRGALKDQRLISRLNAGEVQTSIPLRNILVRFSLSGYFDKNPPCWIMVSHLDGV